VDSFEHGYFLDVEGIELMLRHDTVLVATSAVVRNVASHGVEDGPHPNVHRKAKEAVEHHVRFIGKAFKVGSVEEANSPTW